MAKKLGLGVLILIGVGIIFVLPKLNFGNLFKSKTEDQQTASNIIETFTSASRQALNLGGPPAISTQQAGRFVQPPERSLIQSQFNLTEFGKKLSEENLQRAIKEFGFGNPAVRKQFIFF